MTSPLAELSLPPLGLMAHGPAGDRVALTTRHHFPFLFLGQGCCQREALTQQAAERTHRPVIRGSAQREGRKMSRENICDNMELAEAAPWPKGNCCETSVPWRHRGRGIVTPVLLLLGLALATSLLAVTLLYLRAQSKLQAVEEAVQKLQVSLPPDNASDVSAKGSDNLQLLDEAQAGVQMLKDLLGNVSADPVQIKIRLDISAARPAVKDCCSDVLTKLSRGWRFYGGNLYYFSQGRKSWEEAERYCVSQDSHLTSVSSQAEQEFLTKETKGQNYWIGLIDRETEGSWRWADGTDYRADASRGFWEENQPDNWHQETEGSEDCVETRSMELKSWNDSNCSLPSRWICKQAHRQAGL
ncbi:C-type lectin domain family 4 member F-like isoform X2 [Gopherus evgoodei]|uniref:C-type lectin domain family 4 member F-like isoform X2 n=1 Tax=Gopherus evgoodei TaxID=1825980 RepID=UPI0011CF4FCE|nr:C-type lectin domain family 4 member F-like isoform X2 [Gopherus evgoodei]